MIEDEERPGVMDEFGGFDWDSSNVVQINKCLKSLVDLNG